MTLDEIQRAFDAVESSKLNMALLFDVKAPAAAAGIDPKAFLYVYYSPLRPFSGVTYLLRSLRLKDAAMLNIKHREKQVGILFSNDLLPIEKVEAHDLQLDRQRTYLTMLRDYVGDGGQLIAFRDSKPGEKYGPNGYLLFKNPRGIWQLSRFAPDVGPVGHEEGTPAELTERAMFYRPADGGYIDDIMQGVAP